ncbi:unnamed protein product [Strongylus vulgaris]|uniref:Uncharacterized protein n=1 Tax=Strongylus vulgaris TaxID=40348 RepID=A0A3P7IGP2_STRVU|nr:unnamed protein product [Strongylus vulgaris]
MPSLLLLLTFVVKQVAYSSGQSLVQYELSDLWKTRGINDVYLFPTLTSTIYPGFVGFKRESGSSHIHLTADEILGYESKWVKATQIKSVCSYIYMGSVFYVVNTDAANDRMVEISLNLTMAELEMVTVEMLEKKMKPSHICRGADGHFQ